MDVVKSLGLEKKFSPYNNPDIAWVYVFFPALIFYFSILMNNLNTKPNIGSIEIYDPSFQKLLYSNSKMEVISKGSSWAEGVLWIETDDLSYLLYSDTIQNRIFKWEEGKGFFTVGKTIHIDKSGCRTNISHCENTYEPGTNGLIRMLTQHYPKNIPQGIDIVACQHGERAITFLRQNGTRSFLATQYKGRKFNSPNDLIWSPEGHLYFTDPPYGLYTKHPKKIANREIPFHGIYMIPADAVKESFSSGTPTSNVKLLNKEFSRPNGLAFSPDYTQLYVSNSDATNAIWKVFEVSDTGDLINGRVFYNATESLTSKEEEFGKPDGLKVDIYGNIFATGPGGVVVFNSKGEMIGRLRLDRPAANIWIGSNNYLYIAASELVIRLRINTKPTRFLAKI